MSSTKRHGKTPMRHRTKMYLFYYTRGKKTMSSTKRHCKTPIRHRIKINIFFLFLCPVESNGEKTN